MNTNLARKIPIALILFRLALGPVMLFVAWCVPGSGP